MGDSKRIVTEDDFRIPEFVGAKVDDYEFRDDGKIVRKDRWEKGIRAIWCIVNDGRGEFEIQDVIECVRALVVKADAVEVQE